MKSRKPIAYVPAPDIDERVQRIARTLGLDHIDERVICMRSVGGRSRWTLARCHPLPKIFQEALGVDAHYVVEVIAETFDKLDEAEKTKTLIHELLHIPKAFGGGLKSHRFVSGATVSRLYRRLQNVEEVPGGNPAHVREDIKP